MTLTEIRDQLVRDLLILRDLHGVPITPAHATERANNIAQWVAALVDDARALPAPVLGFEPTFAPRVVSTIRNVPCDGCGKTIERDGVALQVAPEPQRMLRNYHARCRP